MPVYTTEVIDPTIDTDEGDKQTHHGAATFTTKYTMHLMTGVTFLGVVLYSSGDLDFVTRDN